MTDDRLTQMITAQLDLQRELGVDPLLMTDEQRITYVKDNVIALISEINEMLQEIGWKSWTTSQHINQREAFGELRDAWQFLTNLMLAITRDTPEKLAQRLETELYVKHAVNRRRATNGYDGVTGKCLGCKRDLGEVMLVEVHAPTGETEKVFCSSCGTVLPLDVARPYLAD